MRLENMKSASIPANTSADTDSIHNGTLSCDSCNKNTHDDCDMTSIIDEMVRVVDQASTALSDTFDNQVNNRPAAQQWTVCTP